MFVLTWFLTNAQCLPLATRLTFDEVILKTIPPALHQATSSIQELPNLETMQWSIGHYSRYPSEKQRPETNPL
jgi:hypothetical protein